MDLTQFGSIGGLAASVGFFTMLIVSGLTLLYPQRSAGQAWLASVVVGILSCLLMAAAVGIFHGPDVPPLDQLIAQIVAVGIIGGAGAGAANQLTNKADEKRRAVLAENDIGQPLPDLAPLTWTASSDATPKRE